MLSWLLLPTALALTPEDAQAILQIEAQRLPPLALSEFVESEDAETRARAARALGRLRTVAATAPLEDLAADEDPLVRAEAAFALGQTEGSGAFLLERLGEERDPVVRARLCEALGKQGEAEAIDALVRQLAEKPPGLRAPLVAPHAAVALGRMAMRQVEGASGDVAQRALVRQLTRSDRRTRQDAAFALARMARPDPAPDVRQAILRRARRDADPHVRAFLVRAAGALDDPEQALHAFLDEAAGDAAVGVRVAAARAASRQGWLGVSALLDDLDPGVRREAIAAVGALEGLPHDELLRPRLEAGSTLDAAEDARLAGSTALTEGAAALTALHEAGVLGELEPWLAADRPTPVRAAAAGLVDEPGRLVELAREDAEAPVRTAAAYAWSEHEAADLAHAVALLESFDDMVAAVAAEWLLEHPSAEAEGPLLRALLEADEPDLLRFGAEALVPLYEGRRPLVSDPGPEALAVARRAAASDERGAHLAGLALLEVLEEEAPPTAHRVLSVPLDEVEHLRLARVETARGVFTVRLFPDEAPLTVWNFASLAREGYFDGLRVHRVVPDFVMQDGDPRGDGMGGPGWSIPDEINPLPYRTGTVGMALAGPDTGGSQWFVTLSPQPHLDGGYTVFGEIIDGLHVVRAVQPGDRIDRVSIEGAWDRPPREAPSTEAGEGEGEGDRNGAGEGESEGSEAGGSGAGGGSARP